VPGPARALDRVEGLVGGEAARQLLEAQDGAPDRMHAEERGAVAPGLQADQGGSVFCGALPVEPAGELGHGRCLKEGGEGEVPAERLPAARESPPSRKKSPRTPTCSSPRARHRIPAST
jgi:hypothetical protein